MRSRTQTTVWNLFFHYSSIALMILSGLILVPFYLKFIPLGDYGAWLATGNILVWITAVDPGLSTVLQQRVGFAYGRKDNAEIGRIVVSGVSLALAFSLLPLLFGWAFADNIPGWLKLSAGVDGATLTRAFTLAILGTSLAILSYSVTAVNQGLLSSVGIGLIYVVVHAFDIILTIILLHRGWGLMAMAFSFVVRGAGLLIGNSVYLSLRLARGKIPLSFSSSGLADISKVLSFTFFARSGALIAGNMESFLVARFIGASYVPALALTKKSLDISRTFIERPPLAFMPAISHLFGAGELDKVRANLLRLCTILLWTAGLIVGGIFVFNKRFVGLWVGEKYFAGFWINLVLCLNFLLVAMNSALSNLALSLGDIKVNSFVAFLQSVVYIALAVLLARAYGMIGIVSAISLSIIMVSAWYYPRSIASRISIGKADYRPLANEVLFVLAVAAPLVGLFSLLDLSGLAQFLSLSFAFSLLYLSGLALISSSFRKEIGKFYALRYGRLKS